MSKFAEETCEEKIKHYRWLFSEYNRLHSLLTRVQTLHEYNSINRVRNELAAVRDDMDSMYTRQDSRCVLPSFDELVLESRNWRDVDE